MRWRTWSASTSSDGRISTGPKVASASPSAPSNESLASLPTSSWGGDPLPAEPRPRRRVGGASVAGGDARRQHARRRHPDQVPPATDPARELDPGRDVALGIL